MTKAALAKEVHEYLGLSRKEATAMMELIFDTLKATLAEGETIKIPGFGTFIVRKKVARKGRNLSTGEEVPIEPRRVVVFKPSAKLKEMANNAQKT